MLKGPGEKKSTKCEMMRPPNRAKEMNDILQQLCSCTMSSSRRAPPIRFVRNDTNSPRNSMRNMGQMDSYASTTLIVNDFRSPPQ
eukprot:gene24308-10348_t